ncbi:MAG: transposase [Thermodesulfobacteriota bacterium]|nr:transposase [Thermodesulfobacteriota bacterium]
MARTDGIPHRAVVADSWYGTVTEFRKELDNRKERYVVGIHSDTEVFLESPVFVEPEPKEKKRGMPRKYRKLMETNPLPVKVSELGKCVSERDWEYLEIRKDSLDKPLVIEAISRRVWPAKGYRKGIRHEEVWLIIERRHKNKDDDELRYFFSTMPQDTYHGDGSPLS